MTSINFKNANGETIETINGVTCTTEEIWAELFGADHDKHEWTTAEATCDDKHEWTTAEATCDDKTVTTFFFDGTEVEA